MPASVTTGLTTDERAELAAQRKENAQLKRVKGVLRAPS
jgi:hypothetical protein